MTNHRTLVAVLATNALLSGCAGGGGSGSKDDPALAIACAVTVVTCFLIDDGKTSTAAGAPSADYSRRQLDPAFTSWKELPAGFVSADALSLALPYETVTGTRLVAATKEATSIAG